MVYTVLALGVATMDYISIVSAYPKADEKTSAKQHIISGGGNAANSMVALSRLGVTAKLISRIGGDTIGDSIIADLQSDNVDTTYIERSGQSTFSYIIIDEEKHTRTIINHKAASHLEPFEPTADMLEGVNLVHLDGRFPNTARVLAKLAYKHNIPLCVEAEHTKYDQHELFEYATIVITSPQFHKEHYKNENYEENLEDIISLGPRIAVVTLGSKGSMAATKEGMTTVPAQRAHVLDTTGAGDSYIGAFIYGFLRQWDVKRIMEFASLYASKNCEAYGARGGMAYRKDLSTLL